MDPLEKELLGAIRAPTPPLQRVIDRLDAIRAHPADSAQSPERDDPESHHPPLHERLANLGFAAVPPVEPPQMSAAESLLSAATLKELLTDFNERWRRSADAAIGLH